MEMEQYVNLSADPGRNPSEGRENCQSETGRSKVYKLVGVGFGLLCIIQSSLNVALRLQTSAFSNNSNHNFSTDVTPVSSDDLGSWELELENNITELEARITDLVSNNKLLRDWLSEQQNQTVQLQNENSRLMDSLSKWEQGCPRCPPGWRTYMSSCYQLSTEKENWISARNDCRSKEAHLLIVNDDVEMDALSIFGPERMWVGLRRQQNVWTWEDGRTLPNSERIYQSPGYEHQNCGTAVHNHHVYWSSAGCRELHYWVCEKELK